MKIWVKVSRSAQGVTVVTVTVSEDNLSSKYGVKTAGGSIKDAVKEARRDAIKGLEALKAAMREIGDE